MTTQFPFTLQGLHDWLETQDPKTEYDYLDSSDCLLCRFLKENGYAVEPGVSPVRWGDRADPSWSKSNSNELPAAVDDVSRGNAVEENWTYGAALARAKELLA